MRFTIACMCFLVGELNTTTGLLFRAVPRAARSDAPRSLSTTAPLHNRRHLLVGIGVALVPSTAWAKGPSKDALLVVTTAKDLKVVADSLDEFKRR